MFDLGLGYQQAVERVAMVPCELTDRFGMVDADWKSLSAGAQQRGSEVAGSIELAQRPLDGDLLTATALPSGPSSPLGPSNGASVTIGSPRRVRVATS